MRISVWLALMSATSPLCADLRLDITLQGARALLSWTNAQATLEQAATLREEWSPAEGAVSPYRIEPRDGHRFYRLRLVTAGSYEARYVAPTFTTGIGDPASGCSCTSPENPNSLSVGGNPQDNGVGSVLLHTGELTQHAVDLAIPGRGWDWKFERRYRSGMHYDGPLGNGWDFRDNRRLVVQPNGDVLLVDGLGRADRYVRSPAGYVSPSGSYTRLVRHADGTFEERDRYGTIHSYSAASPLGIARLTRIRDRNRNEQGFAYNGLGQLTHVVDTLGRTIGYQYDANGRLTGLTDFIGRTVQFHYDAEGNLAEVTSPAVTGTPHGNDFPLGKTTRYTYSRGFADPRFNHNLLTLTAPNEVAANGPPRLVADYDTSPASSHAGRVISLRLGGTNASGVSAGGTIHYAHVSLGSAPPDDFLTAVFQTTVTNRNGNVAEYQFNQQGHVVRQVRFTRGLRAGEPAGYTNHFEYNADGERIRQIDPEGSWVERRYDAANPDRFQQGNLLEVRRLPGPRGGDQVQLRTTYTYEPLFNQVRTQTEPRGNDASYVPPNGGIPSPERYTLTCLYDYQESPAVPAEASAWGITIPPDWLGLGDLNDDGASGQVHGNLVWRADPTVNLLPGSNQATLEGDAQQEIVTRYVYNRFGQLTQIEDARGNQHTMAYFPENDPDGDGLNLIAGRDLTTGGYLTEQVRDATRGPRRQDPLPPVATRHRFDRDPVGNVTRHTDGSGNTTRYAYNALDQVVEEESPKLDADQQTGYLRRYHYDANSNRIGLDLQNVTTDPSSHLPRLVAEHPFFQHRFAFDILGRQVEEIRDATRDPSVPSSPEPEVVTTRQRYDPNGNPTRIESPLAVLGREPDNVLLYAYDERDLLFSATRGGAAPMAATTVFDYDGNGNLVRWTDAEDNDGTPGPEAQRFAYDGFDRRTSVTDRAGSETRLAYDPAGNRVREEVYGANGFDPTTRVLLRRTFSHFDEQGRPFQVDQALFRPTGVTQQVATVLAEGPLVPSDGALNTRLEYDALDRRTFRVEDDGAVYRTTYDGAGRPIRETLPLVDAVTPGGPHPTQTAFDYDANDNVVRRVDTHTNPDGLVPPSEETHLYVYDALNRRVRTTDALGQTHYREYDSRGNLVASYDARGPLVPDPLGLYPMGSINDRGNVTRYAYDGLNRLWHVERELTLTGEGGAPRDLSNPANPDGLVVTGLTHDANSRLASRSDDLTNRTVYGYDPLNRLVAQTNADGGARTWRHDRDHNPTALRDENNTLHLRSYDALGRCLVHAVQLDPNRTNAAGLPLLVGTTRQTFQYDALSRLTRCTDNNDPADSSDDWTVEAVYDSLGRQIEERQDGRAVAGSYVSDDRAALHYPGSGRVVHLAYDAHDQFVALSNVTQVAIAVPQLGAHCPPAIGYLFTPSNLPPTLTTRIQLNANRCGTQVQQFSAAVGPVGLHTFTRDRGNQVVAASRQALNLPTAFAEQVDLGLDSLSRQSRFRAQIHGPFGDSRTLRQQTINGAQAVTLVRDEQNQVVQEVADSPTHEAVAVPLVYNSVPEDGMAGGDLLPGTGIRTGDTNFVYQWDAWNRLRAVRQRGATANLVARYTYDAWPAIYHGRRVQKHVDHSGELNGVYRFYYDGANAIEETVVPNDGPERVVRQFLFGSRADEVLAMDADTDADGQPDRLSFYQRDHNNNTTILARGDGTPEEFYFYDYRGQPQILDAATGLQLTQSGAGNPYLFTGQRYDPETGLYYAKARYYDPVYGVFLSRDPTGAWGDPANHGHPLAYVGNAAWNRRDPSGLGPSGTKSSIPEEERSAFDWLWKGEKSNILKGLKREVPKRVSMADCPPTDAAGGGERLVVDTVNMAAGDLAGVGGAGPCIGVIMYCQKRIFAFHFFSGSSQIKEPLKAVAAWMMCNREPRIVVLGGDDSAVSNKALKEALDTVKEVKDNLGAEVSYVDEPSGSVYVQKNAAGGLDLVVHKAKGEK